jgi:hypothetical protein
MSTLIHSKDILNIDSIVSTKEDLPSRYGILGGHIVKDHTKNPIWLNILNVLTFGLYGKYSYDKILREYVVLLSKRSQSSNSKIDLDTLSKKVQSLSCFSFHWGEKTQDIEGTIRKVESEVLITELSKAFLSPNPLCSFRQSSKPVSNFFEKKLEKQLIGLREEKREALAIKHLGDKETVKAVSENIQKYQLEQPSLVRIALMAAQKDSSLLSNLAAYGIADQQSLFSIIELCVKYYPSSVCDIGKVALDREHCFALAQKLVDNSATQEFLIRSLSQLHLTEEQESVLFEELVQKNPVALYDNWKAVLEAHARRIGPKIPYFALDSELHELSINPRLRTQDIVPVLRFLHELNKQQGIPLLLYRSTPQGEYIPQSLHFLVKRIADSCATGAELLELASLLNENYFIGTNWLLSQLYSAASTKYPELKTFISLHHEDPFYPTTTPFLQPEGAKWIVASKLERKEKVRLVTTTEVFYLEELQQKIRDFHTSQFQKGAFLLCFPQPEGRTDTPYHYSPIYLEKKGGKLHVFSSDSIVEGQVVSFSEQIITQLSFLTDIPMDIYTAEAGRQFDEFSCSVFTIRDLIESSKGSESGKNIFSFFAQKKGAFSRVAKGIRSRSIKNLPIGMMKLTQSLRKTKEIAEKNLIRVKKGKSEPFESYLQEYGYIAPLIPEPSERKEKAILYKRVNLAAAQKAAHYFERILRHVISG